MDIQTRDFGASKEKESADQRDEVDSGTILQKVENPNEQEEALFGPKSNQARSPEKFERYQGEDGDEQRDLVLTGAQSKTWLSAERRASKRDGKLEEADAYQSVLFARSNFHQSALSPNIDDHDRSSERRQQPRVHLNETSNQIYNQGCGPNDSMNIQLDMSGYSNRPFRPSSQLSDENQNIDDRDSEQIGKRKTIHSMLSVLSLFSG